MRRPSEIQRAEPWGEGTWLRTAERGFLRVLFAAVIVGSLVLDSFTRISGAAHWLQVTAVALLVGRLAIAGREREALDVTTLEARTDELTGLANRRHLYALTDRILDTGERVALLLLDLDRFKELNDTLGHNAGDEVLNQVAVRLLKTIPAGARLARLGGDEFVVLVESIEDEAAALEIARSVREAFDEPFPLEGLAVPVQVSVGAALAPSHATTRQELLRCADVAMYRAKTRQTGVESYTIAGDNHSRDRLLFVSELRHAIDNHELVLHYQPKVSVEDQRFVGAEALVRWRHPRLGLLPPDDFIPLAERNGLMHLLVLTVLDLALRQQREWRKDGQLIPVAVNLSPANLLDTRLPYQIAALLDLCEADPQALELEITEETFMRDPKRALDVIARISELGVEFSLDDFGTGHSSLAQLRRLPVRSLKIDRSFIMSMSESDEDASIVRSTIQLGHSLDLRVVAEGVETEEHMRALKEYGCDVAQGYLFSRPMPPEDVIGWLRENSLEDCAPATAPQRNGARRHSSNA